MANPDYESLKRWFEKQGQDYTEDLRNFAEGNFQLDKILDFAKSKARTDAEREKFEKTSFRESWKSGAGDEFVNAEVERTNQDYLTETTREIDKATSTFTLARVEIDENYLSDTKNNLFISFEEKKSELQEVAVERAEEARERQREILRKEAREELTAESIRRQGFRSVKRFAEFWNLTPKESRDILEERGFTIEEETGRFK